MQKVVPPNAILIPSEAHRVFTGIIFDIYQWPQTLYDGSITTFEMARRPDTAIALCLVGDKIIMINDEQPHRGRRLKLPGGRVEPSDSTVLEAVKREIKEETGYEFTDWRLLSVWQPEVKIEWFMYCFVAWGDTTKGGNAADAGERIRQVFCSLDRVREQVEEGKGMFYLWSLLMQCRSTADLKSLPEYSGSIIEC